MNIDSYVPLDKSWMMRVGMRDIIYRHDDIAKFLDEQEVLSDDLQALKRVTRDWNTEKSLDVGESGTLYRFAKFVSWKYDLNKDFITRGTLKDRNICDDPEIVNWPQEHLLTLDGGTSQWASAAVLAGDKTRLVKPRYKLQLTYDAVKYWNEQRRDKKSWEPRTDMTIQAQAHAYLGFLETGNMVFTPVHSEDYCFARAFGLITPEEGEKKWSSLRNHESDRIAHMDESLVMADAGADVDSLDHRVVQAVVLRQLSRNLPVNIKNKDAVNKSWPEFWDFVNHCKEYAIH